MHIEVRKKYLKLECDITNSKNFISFLITNYYVIIYFTIPYYCIL